MQPPDPSLPPAPPPGPFPATGQIPPGFSPQYGGVAPARRSRRRWWLFGCGGCGAIALIVVVVVVVVVLNGFNSSPLRHFPTEAGASTVGDNFSLSSGQNTETLVIDDPHSLTDVETYYATALNTNGWMAQTTDPSQAVSGDAWLLGRAGSSAPSGGVTFVTKGVITEITVQYQW